MFSFTGKKGISHTISLKNKKLARIVKECRDIPGRELFQFYDEEGNKKRIDSGMVNDYIRRQPDRISVQRISEPGPEACRLYKVFFVAGSAN